MAYPTFALVRSGLKLVLSNPRRLLGSVATVFAAGIVAAVLATVVLALSPLEGVSGLQGIAAQLEAGTFSLEGTQGVWVVAALLVGLYAFSVGVAHMVNGWIRLAAKRGGTVKRESGSGAVWRALSGGLKLGLIVIVAALPVLLAQWLGELAGLNPDATMSYASQVQGGLWLTLFGAAVEVGVYGSFSWVLVSNALGRRDDKMTSPVAPFALALFLPYLGYIGIEYAVSYLGQDQLLMLFQFVGTTALVAVLAAIHGCRQSYEDSSRLWGGA